MSTAEVAGKPYKKIFQEHYIKTILNCRTLVEGLQLKDSALYYAVVNNQPRSVRSALICNANPNAALPMGKSILHVACYYGNAEIISLLVEYGGSVSSTDSWGNTPLHIVVTWGRVDCCRVFLQKCPKEELKKALATVNHNLDTPLGIALFQEKNVFIRKGHRATEILHMFSKYCDIRPTSEELRIYDPGSYLSRDVIEMRLVLVGAGGIGAKSALIVRYLQGSFVEKYDPTIEDSYRQFAMVQGYPCILDIMDTAGQEEFGALRDQYMKTGDGFLLGYSITTDTSFEAARKLYTQILRLKEDEPPQEIPIVLVGNKIDLDDGSDSIWGNRCVSFAEGQGLARELNVPFFETSAKETINIEECILHLAGLVLEKKVRQRGLAQNKVKGGKDRCLLQ